MIFLTSALCAEKLSADFFPQSMQVFFIFCSLGLSVLPAWQKHFQFVAFSWMNGENLMRPFVLC